MAKENYIRLLGQIRSDVLYIRNESGEVVTAIFPLSVIRRDLFNRAGNLNPKWDRPIIASSDKEIIRKIQQVKKHDILDVKGTFRTQYAKKKVKCPFCGEYVTLESPLATINPIFVGIVDDRMQNDTDGANYLMSRAEISNEAKVIGRVCTPTEKIMSGETERGDTFTKYQLAVNRKLFIKDSIDEEDHTDYPVVYSYGNVAKDDFQVLQQNALIYLDGYIHTMMYDQATTCTNCGKDFTFSSQRMNLTPYSNEYLRDYEDVLESTHEGTTQDEPELSEDK